MPFAHLQYVVTKGFSHVLPLRLADPANVDQIQAAFVPYPENETTLTPEQYEQWRSMVRANPNASHWFGMTADKELKLVGEFELKFDAAAAAKANKADGVIPESVFNWMTAQTWAG